ncbi:4-alpha-glucanotransferase, partial [Escherichia coli]|nr:4-alpha-glucanotransferase [Escherichia coli]
THRHQVDLYRWMQWLLEQQLAAAQHEAQVAGMELGVVHDLAVGVHPVGADAWGLGDAMARGVTVGAPPDPFNQLGQNWSQPPWRPD